MSLYLKYRPTRFSQIKGNDNIKAVLEAYFDGTNECPHALLFHGPTGCGKTTFGRIVADKLGCKGIDLQEIDSGQFRGIDTVRDIRKNSQLSAIESECRVWILDEAHKQTTDAQNALLKILEDTPSHVYFIICTTEPDKLIEPIRNRCQQFQVKPLTEDEMHDLLSRIVKREGKELDEELYQQIILDSQGKSREAIQILEQVLIVPEEKRMVVAKQTAERQSQSIELCRLLLGGKARWPEVAKVLTGLKDQDAETIRRSVLYYCQAILLKGQDNDRAGFVMEEFLDPFYNTGFPGLTLACFTVISSK